MASLLVPFITLGKMDVSLLSVVSYIITICLLFTAKDLIFRNASIGKRILKIKVIKANGTNISVIDALKRTMPIALLPIEVFLVITRDKRAGDI